MNSSGLNDNVVSRLASQSDAIGRLAQNSGGFAAVVAAFESKDPDAYRWVLDRLEMLPYCELICEWVRVKMCVLRCFEICGPPPEDVGIPSLEKFANAAVKLASNEKLLRRIVDAVSCGDRDAYSAAIHEGELREFCHLICHWVCSIIYRRVCEVVCRPTPGPVYDAASEIQASGRVIAKLVANKKAFNTIGEAAVALNCETLQNSIQETGFGPDCEVICCFICLWRCVWACREVCGIRRPEPAGVYGIEEARAFALAARQLATQPRALGDLVSAVAKRDAKAYSDIVSRFGLGPYCYQLCAWLCAGICYEFCICVCPKPGLPPIFTSVGDFGIYSNIDSTSGKTNTGSFAFGGPGYAFFGPLQLGGFCPSFSPIDSSVSMQYRFLYSTAATTLASPGINASQTSMNVSSVVTTTTPFNVAICGIPGDPVEIITVKSVSGTTWTVVVRGQGGTTAAPASAGATLAINPASITNNLVSVPPQVPVCSRKIPWASVVPGSPPTAGPTSAATPASQQVMISQPPAPADPPPLTVGVPWVGPSTHYTAPAASGLITVPDPDGWITVDPASEFGGFTPLLVFDSTQVVPGGGVTARDPDGMFTPLPAGTPGTGSSAPGCVPAGNPVSAPSQQAGTDMSIIFQATRVGVTTVDYSNALAKIHINNWDEVTELDFAEFSTGCCTPIDKTLHVEFTVDHEELNAGTWSLTITSCCSSSAPGNITPPYPPAPLPPGDTVIFTAGDRGASGTILEDTSEWGNCSYVVQLDTTPKLTTGLLDRGTLTNQLTFAICSHKPC
jgi:hypothetical protein